MCQKVSESFRTISFEYHLSSACHLGCMNVLAYARICGPVYMRYRSGEINYLYGYKYNFYFFIFFILISCVKQFLLLFFGLTC